MGLRLLGRPALGEDLLAARGGDPGPLSRTRSTAVRPSARSSTSTRGAGEPTAASRALSTRLPTMVTRPPGSTRRSGRRLAAASRSGTPRSAATAALPTRRAASSGSRTFSVTCSAVVRCTPATSVTNSIASSCRPSSSRPRRVWRRLACSWSWARRASMRPRVESSSRPRCSSSVRSRRVATAPPSSVGIRLATRTRGPWTVSRSRPVTRPDRTSAVRPAPSTSSRGRPVTLRDQSPALTGSAGCEGSTGCEGPARSAASGASGVRPSSRAASSLTRRTRPSRSRAITPSRMECSIASRSASRPAISEKARSRVCRWILRDSR